MEEKVMLRKYASIFRTIAIVVTILLVLGGIIAAAESESFMIFLYCTICAGLNCVFMFALAAFFDTTADNNDLLIKIEHNTAKSDLETTQPNSENDVFSQSGTPLDVSPTAEKADSGLADFTVDPNNADNIICSKCGAVQRANRSICFVCGTTFRE